MARKNSFFKLDMLLLCIIAKQDCYGYEITKQIKLYSHELIDIKEGTMYPILYKLLDENYISSYEKVIDRKVRVYYHIEEKDARKKIKKINQERAKHYLYYTNRKWMNFDNYDFILNVDTLGTEESAKFILEYVLRSKK